MMLVEADGSVQINAWWNTLDHLPRPRASLNEQAEEFRALFFDACRLRLRSDVPLATSLTRLIRQTTPERLASVV